MRRGVDRGHAAGEQGPLLTRLSTQIANLNTRSRRRSAANAPRLRTSSRACSAPSAPAAACDLERDFPPHLLNRARRAAADLGGRGVLILQLCPHGLPQRPGGGGLALRRGRCPRSRCRPSRSPGRARPASPRRGAGGPPRSGPPRGGAPPRGGPPSAAAIRSWSGRLGRGASSTGGTGGGSAMPSRATDQTARRPARTPVRLYYVERR